MKKLLLFLGLLFLFDTAETKGQRLYIYGAEHITNTDFVVREFVKIGDKIFGYSASNGLYMSSISDSLKEWRKNVYVLGEGDLITTTNGYVVVSSRAGTYLSPDTGKTWYVNKKHAPFAMLPLPDGSFLAGGWNHNLLRVRTDISPNIANENLWEEFVDSSYWQQNTVSFLYRTSSGRIISYLLGIDDSKGGVWVSDDNAKSWRRPYPNVDVGLGTLFRSMAEYNHVLIARAEDGTFVSYNDGETWNKILDPVFYTPTGQRLYMDSFANVFASPSLGYLLGGDKLLWSWDLSIWEVLFPDSSGISRIYGIINIKEDEILVSAIGGLYLLKMTALTDVPVSSIPTNFILFQNYPNPFNPTTKIKYTISQTSVVNITIYNIIGEKITTLVNEEKSPGTYEVEFDASQLPSGVYFYEMKAGSYTETKKMILIK